MPTTTGSLPRRRAQMASLKNWGDPPTAIQAGIGSETMVECGWGRLIFGQTFTDPKRLAEVIQEEAEGRRDVAFYVRDPQVVLAHAPQALFLDPSRTFRLELSGFAPEALPQPGFSIRPVVTEDEAAVNAIYMAHGMVPVAKGFCAQSGRPKGVLMLVAEDTDFGRVTGVVMGVDHTKVFDDPDNGASLWALAVDPQAKQGGIGEALAIALSHAFKRAGRAFMDLSVMHDNKSAIGLYRKLGFVQVPVYAVKKKNPINEQLFIGPPPEVKLNVYAQIIVDEARRRGIAVTVEDAAAGLFTLSLGGRVISCRESLSDLTSAVAMSRCDDKSLTHRLLKRAGLSVPAQRIVTAKREARDFLARHRRVVVKPLRGEQGRCVFVDLEEAAEVDAAFEKAREVCDQVVMEEYVKGEDLRIIVIDSEVVAAAVRRPAGVVGDGRHTIKELIEKQSRRRAAATQGESQIPLDSETARCVAQASHEMSDVLPEGERLDVRKTANLHTGGTIHDVTPELHPDLTSAAVRAAQALDMPVVGLDMIVRAPDRPIYHFIEANERPGLANHEPAPTVERFVDFLFPQTKGESRSATAASER